MHERAFKSGYFDRQVSCSRKGHSFPRRHQPVGCGPESLASNGISCTGINLDSWRKFVLQSEVGQFAGSNPGQLGIVLTTYGVQLPVWQGSGEPILTKFVVMSASFFNLASELQQSGLLHEALHIALQLTDQQLLFTLTGNPEDLESKQNYASVIDCMECFW